MIKKQTLKKLTIYFSFLVLVFCFLFLNSSQGQASESDIILSWSTNSYIPFDYLGKALPAQGSLIEVTALIDSKTINPEKLNYYWYLDNSLQREKSGLGKQVFQFEAIRASGQTNKIKAWISNQENTFFLKKDISIKIVSPQVILYSSTGQAVQNYQISAGQAISLIALPYFFNIKNLNELDYNWSLGTQKASQISPANPNIFTLKTGQVNETITNHLRLWVFNKNNSSQRAANKVAITIIP